MRTVKIPKLATLFLFLILLFQYRTSFSQNVKIKHSEKLIFDNWKDGAYKKVLGSNEEYTYVLYNDMNRTQAGSKKFQIYAFKNTDLSVAFITKIKGYLKNSRDKKTVRRTRRLKFISSIITSNGILIFWEEHIKNIKHVYGEVYSKNLVQIKPKTLLYNFQTTKKNDFIGYADLDYYSTICQNDQILLIHITNFNSPSSINFNCLLFDTNLKKIYDHKIESKHKIKSTDFFESKYLKIKIVSFTDEEIVLCVNNETVIIDIEHGDFEIYKPKLPDDLVTSSLESFEENGKLYFTGFYTSRKGYGQKYDFETLKFATKGFFYCEMGKESEAMYVDFSKTQLDLMHINNIPCTHNFIGMNQIDDSTKIFVFEQNTNDNTDDRYTHLFRDITSLTFISVKYDTKIDWVKTIDCQKNTKLITNANSISVIEDASSYENKYSSLKCRTIYGNSTIIEKLVDLKIENYRRQGTFKSKLFNANNFMALNNKIYYVSSERVIKLASIPIRIGSIIFWPALPGTIMNADLLRYEGHLIEISLEE